MTGATGADAVDLEQALTMLAWSDPAVTQDPAAALAQLGVEVPAGWRVDLRIQRPDTLYLVIPPAFSDEGENERVVTRWTCGAVASSSSGSCPKRRSCRCSRCASSTEIMAARTASEQRPLHRALPAAQCRPRHASAAAGRSEGGARRVLRRDPRRRLPHRGHRAAPGHDHCGAADSPEPGTDPAARLADVSGRIYDMLHTTGIGGYLVPDDALTWVLRDMRALWARSSDSDEGMTT